MKPRTKSSLFARSYYQAVLCAALLAGCAPQHRSAIEGVLVVDEEVVLVRGQKFDGVRREFPADGDATFVVQVTEDDVDVKVVLSHDGAQGVGPAKIEIDSKLHGEGIEIAALDVPRNSRTTLSLESPQDFARPGKVRLKVRRYDADSLQDPRATARVAAYRAWSAATGARLTGDDLVKTTLRDIDIALAHFEGVDGDPALAAWSRMIRCRVHYQLFTKLDVSVADAKLAERGFAALGQSRNAARARLLQAATLVEIAANKAAKNPTAAEAAHESRRILTGLSNESAMSALERTRAVNYLGVLEYHLYDVPAARVQFQAVLLAYEELGYRQGQHQVLSNLGVLAFEVGDYLAATKYFDRLVDEIDFAGSSTMQTMVLFNASEIDSILGNVDKAIERLLLALELTREHKLAQHEARVLYGLGRAYLERGDRAQAKALLDEALKLRRTMEDSTGLVVSLIANGALARETGDIPKAIALHREAVSLSTSPNGRVFTLLHLARDYKAASDYRQAIATCREALLVRAGVPGFYARHAVHLALADMLLAQPNRTSKDIQEATRLAEESLSASILRADIVPEIAARRLLAEAHVARHAPREARDEYEKAIALIFKYRSTINNPELRAAAVAQEQQAFRGYVDLLMSDVAKRGPGNLLRVNAAEEEALRTLEWARAINFDTGTGSQLDAKTQARLDELLAQMAGKRVRIAALLDKDRDVSRELDVLQIDIARLRAEVDQLRATASRQATSAGDSKLVAAPWPEISPGTLQLSYALETDHAYLWVRDASGIRATVLAAKPAAIARDVAALSGAVRRNGVQGLEAILARLSTGLLPAGAVGDDSTTLEIVAEGQAAAVPFAALSTAPQIVMIGSLFEGRVRPRPVLPRPLGFVALASGARSKGDPAAQVFPALHGAGAETRAIAAQFQSRKPPAQVKLLFGAEGSAANLAKAWKGGVDVVHFATHGLADLRQPLASLLLLPALDDAGSPTYLTAGQVQEWRGDADLVYLSACETAVGPARFADGLPGLQRAFLRAGARGVVATLWPVEDVYASQFATDFYRRYTGGMSASQSLSETQRAWMLPVPGIRESEQAHRRMTAWAHAYYAQ